MEIQQQNTLEHALKNGINLFVGAGFSILAKDADNRKLPTGGQLAAELANHFSHNEIPLPQLSTILESTNKKISTNIWLDVLQLTLLMNYITTFLMLT